MHSRMQLFQVPSTATPGTQSLTRASLHLRTPDRGVGAKIASGDAFIWSVYPTLLTTRELCYVAADASSRSASQHEGTCSRNPLVHVQVHMFSRPIATICNTLINVRLDGQRHAVLIAGGRDVSDCAVITRISANKSLWFPDDCQAYQGTRTVQCCWNTRHRSLRTTCAHARRSLWVGCITCASQLQARPGSCCGLGTEAKHDAEASTCDTQHCDRDATARDNAMAHLLSHPTSFALQPLQPLKIGLPLRIAGPYKGWT